MRSKDARARNVLFGLAWLTTMIGPACALEGARTQVTLHPISAWTKICGKDAAGKAACYTSRHFGRDPRKPPILDLSVADTSAGPVARFLLPVGLQADRGLTFSVDGGERVPGRFEACVPNGCFAQAAFENSVLAALKKGGTMQVSTTDTKGRRVDFYLSLDGFAAAYGGAGVDAGTIPPLRKKLPDRPGLSRPGGTGI